MFREHDGGQVGIGRRNRGHDGSVDYMQIVDSMDSSAHYGRAIALLVAEPSNSRTSSSLVCPKCKYH